MATGTNADTASGTYSKRREDIAKLMDVLQMELDNFDERASRSPRDWGFAGSLGKVRSDLIESVASLSGMSPDRVCEFLDESD